jgi:hypothetical protein
MSQPPSIEIFTVTPTASSTPDPHSPASFPSAGASFAGATTRQSMVPTSTTATKQQQKPQGVEDDTSDTASTTTNIIDYRQFLVEFYTQHNPSKLASVDQTLVTYLGRYEEMTAKLTAKYVTKRNNNKSLEQANDNMSGYEVDASKASGQETPTVSMPSLAVSTVNTPIPFGALEGSSTGTAPFSFGGIRSGTSAASKSPFSSLLQGTMSLEHDKDTSKPSSDTDATKANSTETPTVFTSSLAVLTDNTPIAVGASETGGFGTAPFSFYGTGPGTSGVNKSPLSSLFPVPKPLKQAKDSMVSSGADAPKVSGKETSTASTSSSAVSTESTPIAFDASGDSGIPLSFGEIGPGTSATNKCPFSSSSQSTKPLDQRNNSVSSSESSVPALFLSKSPPIIHSASKSPVPSCTRLTKETRASTETDRPVVTDGPVVRNCLGQTKESKLSSKPDVLVTTGAPATKPLGSTLKIIDGEEEALVANATQVSMVLDPPKDSRVYSVAGPRGTPVKKTLHQTKESVRSSETQLSAPSDTKTTTLSTSIGVSPRPESTTMQRKLSKQGASSEMSQQNREGLWGAGDHSKSTSSTSSFALKPAASFERPPESASMVDAAHGVTCEMARNPPDLSFPQMNKPLGQVEKSQSSGGGEVKAINQTGSGSDQPTWPPAGPTKTGGAMEAAELLSRSKESTPSVFKFGKDRSPSVFKFGRGSGLAALVSDATAKTENVAEPASWSIGKERLGIGGTVRFESNEAEDHIEVYQDDGVISLPKRFILDPLSMPIIIASNHIPEQNRSVNIENPLCEICLKSSAGPAVRLPKTPKLALIEDYQSTRTMHYSFDPLTSSLHAYGSEVSQVLVPVATKSTAIGGVTDVDPDDGRRSPITNEATGNKASRQVNLDNATDLANNAAGAVEAQEADPDLGLLSMPIGLLFDPLSISILLQSMDSAEQTRSVDIESSLRELCLKSTSGPAARSPKRPAFALTEDYQSSLSVNYLFDPLTLKLHTYVSESTKVRGLVAQFEILAAKFESLKRSKR